MSHLDKSEYRVINVSHAVALRMCVEHHYAKGGPKTAVFTHGLVHVSDALHCLGVALWLPPTRVAAESVWDGDFREVLSLSRLVLAPDLPTNAASFLIGQSVRLIKRDGRFRCLVTYADTWQGHTGAIYRATNWEYLGLVSGSPTWVSEEGRMTSRKSASKNRTPVQMAELGYTNAGTHPKHKYRMVLPAPKEKAPRGQLQLLEETA